MVDGYLGVRKSLYLTKVNHTHGLFQGKHFWETGYGLAIRIHFAENQNQIEDQDFLRLHDSLEAFAVHRDVRI